jgi:hypothetical protein
MGWSITVKGKRGEDILEKYNIQHQFLGLAPGSIQESKVRYVVDDLRLAVERIPYKDQFPKAAQDAIEAVKSMLRDNIESLKPHHDCPDCKCESDKPDKWSWSLEAAERFLSIPTEEVHKITGGY